MVRNIMIGIGTVLSGILGFTMFKITGLCDACVSGWLQYVMGIAFVFIYLSSFRSGALNSKARLDLRDT